MSEFEFVQITFAIILGLGVTSVLSSIADQLKSRKTNSPSAIQLYSQFVLLLLLLIHLWGFWAARDIDWNITLFLFHALSPICYAVAAYSSRVHLGASAPPIEDQYFENKPVFYGFWVLASFFGLCLTFFYMRILDASFQEALPLFALRATDFLLLVVLLVSNKRPVHWTALSAMLMISSSILFSYFLELE